MEYFNTVYGSFLVANTALYTVGSVLVVLILGYTGARLILWSLVAAAILVGYGVPLPIIYVYLGLAAIFNITPLRRLLVSSWFANLMKPIMPKISATERTALEAGVVWIEKDLFSGKPNFKNILQEPYPELTAEEKAFMEGPVQRLCAACDDWEIWQEKELPDHVWDIIKKEKFFGMVIPKKYGGLGFSALAHSEVIMTIASRSVPACVTVMVPNSLGPAELIVHYGTDEQKNRLLPKLASGDEIPCFALTEPLAGSDAGAMQSTGVLFKGDDGKLKIKLNWDKRWITLAAIATTLGMAFKLKDPDNLLGTGKKELGITCALIPSNLPGVTIGRRHDPLGVPFYNCPLQGKDVIVDAEECIVGGVKNVGKGWAMLMECLAAGRGVSLPAQSSGCGKLALRFASNHATIRKQFGMSIGMFEGIEEPLARIAGYNYLLEAARRFTVGALDKGIKPPVITAMLKYNSTELMRQALNDAMDLSGGTGISRGPRNLIANSYIGAPIGITVEGANILTRTLMVFGQGALRAHPFASAEVFSLEKNDIAGFDKAFFGHFGHIVRNLFRSTLLSLTRGRLYISPVGGPVAKYYRQMAWTSATFALMSDLAMGLLGGTLKARQMITGRFADILSWMYLGTCVLRRYEADGRRKEDLPFVHYCMKHAFCEIQKSFDGIFKNIGGPLGIGFFFKRVVRIWSRMNSLGFEVADNIVHQVASLSQKEGEQRDRFVEGLYFPDMSLGDEPLVKQEKAFKAIQESNKIIRKMRKAVKAKKIPRKKGGALVKEALKAGVITDAEAATLQKTEELRYDAITVDDFSQEEYIGKAGAQPGEYLRKVG